MLQLDCRITNLASLSTFHN